MIIVFESMKRRGENRDQLTLSESLSRKSAGFLAPLGCTGAEDGPRAEVDALLSKDDFF